MSATDGLTDAGGLTKRYLSALWVRDLLKLGVVVLFLGGSFAVIQLVSAPFDPETIEEPADLWNFAWLIAGGVGLYAAVRYLAATLEFVFVTSLRTREVALRRYLRDHLRAGLWLLVFRAGIVAGALAVVAAAAALIVGTDPAAFGAATAQQGIAVAVVALLAGLIWFTVDTLTTGFVVPVMQHTRCGPLSGWRRFLGAISSNWTSVLAFLAVAWIVGFALWMVLVGLGFVVSLFGTLILVLIGSALTELHSAFETVVLVALVIGFVGYQYAMALIEAPVRSYVRYYALVVLGETAPELDLIAEYRTAIAEPANADPTDSPREPSTDNAEPAAESAEHAANASETAADGTESEKTADDAAEN